MELLSILNMFEGKSKPKKASFLPILFSQNKSEFVIWKVNFTVTHFSYKWNLNMKITMHHEPNIFFTSVLFCGKEIAGHDRIVLDLTPAFKSAKIRSGIVNKQSAAA